MTSAAAKAPKFCLALLALGLFSLIPLAAAQAAQPLPGAPPMAVTLPGDAPVQPDPALMAKAATEAAAKAQAIQGEAQLTFEDVRDKLTVTRDEIWIHRDQQAYGELLKKFQTTLAGAQ